MSEDALSPLHNELQRERLVLVTADHHLSAGNDRLRRQQELVRDLQEKGREDRDAMRYLDLLTSTMREWERHRQLIVERVLYLERQARAA